MSTGKARGEERRDEESEKMGKMDTGEIERYNKGHMRKERSIGSHRILQSLAGAKQKP